MHAQESVKATLVMYDGLAFDQKIGYESELGAKVDMTDWHGKLVFMDKVGGTAQITFQTSDGTMVLSVGVIELIASAATRTWKQGVGHLVLGPSPETAKVVAFLGIVNRPTTTGMPA